MQRQSMDRMTWKTFKCFKYYGFQYFWGESKGLLAQRIETITIQVVGLASWMCSKAGCFAPGLAVAGGCLVRTVGRLPNKIG